MLIDSYQRNIQRKRSDLAKLSVDKAREQKKASDATQKIERAKRTLNTTKSLSTQKSKASEILRLEKSNLTIVKKIADIELKKIMNWTLRKRNFKRKKQG